MGAAKFGIRAPMMKTDAAIFTHSFYCHRTSSRMLTLFDSPLLLVVGKICYYGPPTSSSRSGFTPRLPPYRRDGMPRRVQIRFSRIRASKCPVTCKPRFVSTRPKKKKREKLHRCTARIFSTASYIPLPAGCVTDCDCCRFLAQL